MSHEAVSNSPLAANIIAINPEARFSEVIKFGIYFIVKSDIVIRNWSKNKKIFFLLLLDLYQIIYYLMIDFAGIRIAVDFDGTIVEHEYPEIGKEKLFAFQTLNELDKMGARLILWTFRTGKELDNAVEYCRKNGIEFYAVNKNYPEEIFDETVSRKIDADIYIDDKNIGGFPGWSEIWQLLNPFELQQQQAEKRMASVRRNIFKRLFPKKTKSNEN